jgi:hypothetical protein
VGSTRSVYVYPELAKQLYRLYGESVNMKYPSGGSLLPFGLLSKRSGMIGNISLAEYIENFDMLLPFSKLLRAHTKYLADPADVLRFLNISLACNGCSGSQMS